MKYEVQTDTICEGWVNCWTHNGDIEYFDTKGDAQEAIDTHIQDTLNAFHAGYMDSPMYKDDYRIVEIKE